ncbi:peptide chain release factor N(5)-glutamine methyltransferase [Enterococcus faecalis]
MGNSYFEVLQRASSFLEAKGKEGYSIQYLLLERKGWDKTQWLLHLHEPMPVIEEQQVAQDVERLVQDYPPQYILGFSEFYGHRFQVNEHTLIPRPETEELVQQCLVENDTAPRTVVDVGTGTGAIAISLKLARPQWRVIAIDISADTLKVAQHNAQALAADIELLQSDGLQALRAVAIDVLISNPPYISSKEWELMDPSVRLYEPKKALFAENQGLSMYQQLVTESQSFLKPAGKIYFEIGYQQGAAVKEILAQSYPDKQLRIQQDLSGRDRIVIAD